MKKHTTYEVCPHCEHEVELDAELKVQTCPVCGKRIVTCSMCRATDANDGRNYCANCCLCHQAEAENAEEATTSKSEWQVLLDTANEALLKKGYSIRITEDEDGFYSCDILYHNILKDGVKETTYAENYYEEELTDLITDAWHYASTL